MYMSNACHAGAISSSTHCHKDTTCRQHVTSKPNIGATCYRREYSSRANIRCTFENPCIFGELYFAMHTEVICVPHVYSFTNNFTYCPISSGCYSTATEFTNIHGVARKLCCGGGNAKKKQLTCPSDLECLCMLNSHIFFLAGYG